MQRSLFTGIMGKLGDEYAYFQQKSDATDYSGFHPFIKGTASMRMLAYAGPADAADAYLKMGASIAREALIRFCEGVIEYYGEQYLRSPNEDGLDRLLVTMPSAGSQTCLDQSTPCTENGKIAQLDGKANIRVTKVQLPLFLEAITSHYLYIWHSFFDVQYTCKNINVLHKYPLFNNIVHDIAPESQVHH